jgi:hypothetical protein
MEDPQNRNYGGQRKWFVRMDLQYTKKSIRSTDKAFHGLQNDVFSFSVCNERVMQNCTNQNLLLESESFWSIVLLTI